MEWRTDDWDPALRYWTLPYDRNLTEWLRLVDQSRPSIMAGREFGSKPSLWQFEREELVARGWLELNDLRWQPNAPIKSKLPADWPAAKNAAFGRIHSEIAQLQMLMQDDRDRYLAEIDAEADGLAEYFVAFIGASQGRYPWTLELINTGLAIGNLTYAYYKAKFKRVRPSVLCPGLVPPFGPPAHPAFPSGHSFLGHFIALLLLEIPALRQRYGVFASGAAVGDKVEANNAGRQVTISIANPAVVTLNAHGFQVNDQVSFQTTGKLPAPISAAQVYYVKSDGLTDDTFQISASLDSAALGTSGSQSGKHTLPGNPLAGTGEITSPMLWLAQRLAKNRERLGVHYASDSSASRHLAAAVWRALLHDAGVGHIDSPTLRTVLNHAIAEWPTRWP